MGEVRLSLPPAGPEPKQNRDLSSLTPSMQTRAIALIVQSARAGVPLLVVEARRSFERQAWLYSLGRTHSHPSTGSERIVTRAKPGESNHEDGNAIDVVPVWRRGDGKVEAAWESPHWPVVAKIGRDLGLRWGGDFTTIHDPNHFELGD